MSIRKRSDRAYSAHLQGTLDLMILRMLQAGPQHGQGIARRIQRESDNVFIVDHGSLYPALQRLENRCFIDAEWGTSETNRRARFYTLTPKGRKELVREKGRVATHRVSHHACPRTRIGVAPVKRAAWVVSLLAYTACGGSRSVDRQKFEAVRVVGQRLRADVESSGGIGSERFPDLLRQFQEEISALDSRISGRQEGEALKSYATASDAYRYFLRFKRLDADAVDGMVLLRGANRPVAFSYGLPMESRGGGRWVNRLTAMKMFSDAAVTALARANLDAKSGS